MKQHNGSDCPATSDEAETQPFDRESHLSTIFARAQVGLSEIALNGRFLRTNDELCRMLGRPCNELLNLSVTDVTHPDDLERTRAALGQLLDSGEPVSLDKRYTRPDGTFVYTNSALTRLDDKDGEPLSVLAVTVDLTERKRTSDALAENEARFRALAEASPALIWHLAPCGSVIYLNPRFLALLGRSQEELLGTAWHAVLHPEDTVAYLDAVARAQRETSSFQERVRVRAGDDSWRWLGTYGAPWFNADGHYAGHVGISIDITDAVQAQQQLLITNERLNLAIEGSRDGVWDWDIQTGRLVISDRPRQILGFSGQDKFDSIDD